MASIPLHRRLKAWRRRFVGFLFWLACAAFTAFLYANEASSYPVQAIALSPAATLLAPEGGRLAELTVTPGQAVEAGATLGRIEIPGVQQEIAAMTAGLEVLRASGGIDDAERERRMAKDRDSARARWLSATVALREAEAALSEISLMRDRVNTPGTSLPAAEVEATNARWEAARATVAARQAEVGDLQRAMNAASGRAGAMIDPALETQAEALRLRIQALQALQEASTLRAPISGIVSGPAPDAPGLSGLDLPVVGSWIPAGAPVLRVQATSTREAVAWLQPAQAAALQSGQSMQLDGAAGLVEATVRTIGPGLQPLPAQLLADPQRPEWRLPVLLVVTSSLLPGEILRAK